MTTAEIRALLSALNDVVSDTTMTWKEKVLAIESVASESDRANIEEFVGWWPE